MEIRLIPQYAGDSAHFKEVNSLLSTNEYCLFRTLMAYVSLGGIKIIEDTLFDFLNRGNFVDWIIGIDGEITSKDSLDYMLFLKKKFPKNVRVRIFTSGSNRIIFHPKIYWLCNSEKHSIILGSSNFTEGGLKINFEASALLCMDVNEGVDKKTINEFENLWQKFSTPALPLTEDHLIDLTQAVIDFIDSQVDSEGKTLLKIRKKMSHPFSKVDKSKEIRENIKRLHGITPRTGIKRPSAKKAGTGASSIKHPNQLVMDILTETRDTQVQIPTEVLKDFFQITDTNKKNEIILTEILDGNPLQSKIRPLISQKNKTHRFEISGVKGRVRPLIIKFIRLDDGEFEYEIISKSHPDFISLNKLLNDSGKQKRKDSRRWILIT